MKPSIIATCFCLFSALFFIESASATQCEYVDEKKAHLYSKNSMLIRIDKATAYEASGEVIEAFKGISKRNIELKASKAYRSFNTSMPLTAGTTYLVATNKYSITPDKDSGVIEVHLCELALRKVGKTDKLLKWIHSDEYKNKLNDVTRESPKTNE